MTYIIMAYIVMVYIVMAYNAQIRCQLPTGWYMVMASVFVA